MLSKVNCLNIIFKISLAKTFGLNSQNDDFFAQFTVRLHKKRIMEETQSLLLLEPDPHSHQDYYIGL